ncbi:U32 family peptidase [Flavonifractor plautii]|uniref:U32 family peptidase n=1 Tax=Flavonifractor plautii TaxID=292800 RepID=UPI00214CEFE3|nr:U32 family peptidase [Flavonifractor plautii]MCR1910303.1 U32 family peptidase [Flavonifractor plautii]
MLELLAPAGSMEAVAAAVQNGADAVYLGYGDFNARRNAKNFSEEEFAAAVSYCHLRGAKVYLTLNTLLTDRELPKAAEVAAQASAIGADAVLIQDLGVLRMLRQVAPDLPVHASTQMTLHNLDGVKMAADLGLTRAVLSRELSRDQIESICQRAPIEIEVFAHGALCMCYSGQCFLSSVIGGRSGNRGLCAQPCRLKYGWMDKADAYPLSLKDLSLAGHLRELRRMGVACVKLEGRMKRPEYVAVVTGIYARAIREDREPTEEELEQLRAAFSRQGFTQGYYLDQQGPDMFGVREETREPKELFAAARNTYQSGEAQRVPVTFYAMLRPGEPARVGVEDPDGRVATVEGPVPEAARTRPLTAEAVTTQLSRTGGTPYRCGQVRALVEENLSLPLAALNALRREALEKLSVQRQEPPRRRAGEYHAGARYENRREEPVLTISVRRAEQLTDELLRLRPALVYVPLDELAAHPEKAAGTEHTSIGVSLPRVAWDREYPGLREKLEQVRALGVKDALLGNLGMFPIARGLGFTLRGDFGLEIYNAQALKEYKRLGLQSATLSFELKLAQLRDLSKCLDTELITYGRLPLMLMENCIIKNRTGSCGCQNTNILTDRKGARFPVVSAPGCRNELLNSQKLFLADKAADYRRIGLWAQRLLFTTENPRECVQVAQRYLEQGSWAPNEYTRGLYYRDVE